MKGTRPPREGLARLVNPGPEIRDGSSGGTATLSGDFAVFGQWTEIDSIFEGRFMESIAPGAFTKTIAENRDSMRILLNHGHDSLGNQPIAALTDLRETKTGAHYEADLLEGVPPLVVSGLRKGQYGSSFRFDVINDTFEKSPKASAYNPSALPERVIREARVFEFGPVTFPAYAGATAGVRSMTDEFLFERLVQDPRFSRSLGAFIDQADELVDAILDDHGITDPDEQADGEVENAGRLQGIVRKLALMKAKAPSTVVAAATPHADAGRPLPPTRRFRSEKEWLTWLSSS